jgi:hypothetical protein
MSAPGIGWVLGLRIALEIGTTAGFASPRQRAGYTASARGVEQSRESDRRGPLPKNGPKSPPNPSQSLANQITVWQSVPPARDSARGRSVHAGSELLAVGGVCERLT